MDREIADDIKRHFSVVAEGLRSEIRAVAEGVAGTNERLDRFQSQMAEETSEIKAMIRISFGQLDHRITTLEGSVSNLRARLERLEARFGN